VSEPLSDKEKRVRQFASEVESEADELSVERAFLAIKATLGSERAAEELSALDDRVSSLTDEAIGLEAQAAKERSDAELRQPEYVRRALREKQESEERILEVTNTRRQLMIDAGALGIAPGSEEMLKIAISVEDRMRRRFGEEAQWHMPVDDAEFGVEWRDGQVCAAPPPQ
jgi:hypothetical protein